MLIKFNLILHCIDSVLDTVSEPYDASMTSSLICVLIAAVHLRWTGVTVLCTWDEQQLLYWAPEMNRCYCTVLAVDSSSDTAHLKSLLDIISNNGFRFPGAYARSHPGCKQYALLVTLSSVFTPNYLSMYLYHYILNVYWCWSFKIWSAKTNFRSQDWF